MQEQDSHYSIRFAFKQCNTAEQNWNWQNVNVMQLRPAIIAVGPSVIPTQLIILLDRAGFSWFDVLETYVISFVI